MDIMSSNISNYIIGAGGKRIRPLLTLASARLCQYSGNRHLNLASAIEFIHTATLLHDDVVDGSKKRRGKKTANFIWGNKSSILVGDFLLSKAFKILINDGSLKCIDIVSNVSEKISFGEVKQLMSIGKLNVSESDYLEIIGFKTAELFSAACQLSSEISEIDFTKKKSLKVIIFSTNLFSSLALGTVVVICSCFIKALERFINIAFLCEVVLLSFLFLILCFIFIY